MPEYFIRANSFAAPFMSDQSDHFVEADSPQAALQKLADEYTHPFGLYAAAAWQDANACLKGEPALASWLCNTAIAIAEATKDKHGYGFLREGNRFQIDDVWHTVENPQGGKIVEAAP